MAHRRKTGHLVVGAVNGVSKSRTLIKSSEYRNLRRRLRYRLETRRLNRAAKDRRRKIRDRDQIDMFLRSRVASRSPTPYYRINRAGPKNSPATDRSRASGRSFQYRRRTVGRFS